MLSPRIERSFQSAFVSAAEITAERRTEAGGGLSSEDTISSAKSRVSLFSKYFVKPISSFFQWVIQWICCCRKKRHIGAGENTISEFEKIEKLQQDFPIKRKIDGFAVWWRNSFDLLSNETKDQIIHLAASSVNRDFALEFVRSLQLVNTGEKILNPIDFIPGYLQIIKDRMSL